MKILVFTVDLTKFKIPTLPPLKDLVPPKPELWEAFKNGR